MTLAAAADHVQSARDLLAAACEGLCLALVAVDLEENQDRARRGIVAAMDAIVEASANLHNAHDHIDIAARHAPATDG